MQSWKSYLAGTAFGLALSLGGAAFSLTGCASEESSDNAPPDPIIKLEKSQGKYRFGLTDTVVIDFSKDIDTFGLAVAIAPSAGVEKRFRGRRQLRIFGAAKTSGTSHFNVNSPFTVTLAGIRDLDGNLRGGDFSESFQPYAWTDRDFVDTAFSGYDSLMASATTWIDGSPMTDSLVTEGRLDFNSNFGREDRQDYKIIRMLPPDSLKLVLTCSKDLNLRMQIAGPFAEEGLDSALADFKFSGSFYSDSTKAKGTLSTRFDASFDTHFDVLGSSSAPGIYVIRLSIPADTEGFYRLGLMLQKRKK